MQVDPYVHAVANSIREEGTPWNLSDERIAFSHFFIGPLYVDKRDISLLKLTCSLIIFQYQIYLCLPITLHECHI